MLSKEQIEEIAKIARLDPAKLTEAITSTETVAVDIPAVTSFTEEEVTRIKNAEYNSGKEKGVEMAVKDTKAKLGLEFTGKTVENLIEAAQKKALADANIDPAKQNTEAAQKIQTLQDEVNRLTKEKGTLESTASQAITDRDIYKAVPSLGEKAPSVDAVLRLMRLDGYDFTKNEAGELVAKRGDKIEMDNTAKAIPVADVIKGYAKSQNLIQDAPEPPKGRGGDDSGHTPTYSKLSEFEKSWKESGKSPNGVEFMNKVTELKTANPDFDLAT